MRQRVGEGDEENDEKNKEDLFLICVCVFLEDVTSIQGLDSSAAKKVAASCSTSSKHTDPGKGSAAE